MVLIDKDYLPKTHEELKKWVIEKSKKRLPHSHGRCTRCSKYNNGGPVPTHIKPIWPFISFTAFNTLPKEFKEIYGIKDTKLKSILLNFNLYLLKFTRPFLPPFFRLIAPARWAKQRLTKNPNLSFKDKSKL